jgi:hypothetical protein
MKHAVKQIRFIGMVDPSREQGSRLRDATGREDRRMPMFDLARGEGER